MRVNTIVFLPLICFFFVFFCNQQQKKLSKQMMQEEEKKEVEAGWELRSESVSFACSNVCSSKRQKVWCVVLR
jgi:hypothetical protein